MASRLAVSLAVCVAYGLPPSALSLRPEQQRNAEATSSERSESEAAGFDDGELARGRQVVFSTVAEVDSAGVAIVAPVKTEALVAQHGPDLAASSMVEISTLDGILIASPFVADFGTGDAETSPSDASSEASQLSSAGAVPESGLVEDTETIREFEGHTAAHGSRQQAAVAALTAAVRESSALEGEFLPVLACTEDFQGQRIGCKGMCACMWWESCYTRRNTETPFEDTGVCEMSMRIMSGVAFLLTMALLLLTLSSRIVLQERELMQAMKAKNWEDRATMRENLYAMHGRALAQQMAAKSKANERAAQ